MSFDLSELLSDWPYEPGQLQVRRVQGGDGRPIVQLRLDMGVLQMEELGRPDGQTPHDAESLFDYHQQRARSQGAGFQLTPEEIGDLQAEGIQYYHRYLALFQLQDWSGVIRDTKRNLEMFNFVARHAPSEELAWSVQQFRPYVLMMNTRAKGNSAIEKQDINAAISLVERGIQRIEEFLREAGREEEDGDNTEVANLREWLRDLRKQRPKAPPKPLTPLEKMRRDMQKAIRAENYEKAAQLRDAINSLKSEA